MAGLFARMRWRGAVGLIAAYALALQTLFAAFAPLPASALHAGSDALSVICLGSGPGDAMAGDPAGHPPASSKLHCVLCISPLAGAAVLPAPAGVSPPPALLARYSQAPAEILTAPLPVRAGPARAPPLTV